MRYFDGHKGLRDLGISAMFRLEALMRVVAAGKLPGWTKAQGEDGVALAHPALIIAAGEAPVVARGGQVNFSRKAILLLAFQHAKTIELR